MYRCESWTIRKTEHRRIDAFKLWCWEKTLERPLDSKKFKPVNPKRNQPWIFIGRADIEPVILWPPDAKSHLTGKDPDSGKDWGQEEKGATEDEMVGGLHQLNGHEFEQTLGDTEGLGSLVCCSSWGLRVRHEWATEQQWTTTAKIFSKLFYKAASNLEINSVSLPLSVRWP